MATETTPKKARKPRANYEKTVRELRTYIAVKLQVFADLSGGAPTSERIAGQIAELEAVKARLGE